MARTKTKPVGRTPTKRKACESWLLQQLAPHPCLARDVLSLGASSGWGWATVRRAKVNVGAQSFRKGEEWWWFDPRKFDPKKETPPQKPVGPSQKITAAPTLPEIPEIPAAISPTYAEHNPQPSVTFPALTPLAPPPGKSAPLNLSLPAKLVEQRSTAPTPPPVPQAVPPAVPRTQEPPPPKPTEPPKPRRIHIWDSALTESRDAFISSAGFADLYTMRADIRFRQEHLRAKGLLKEEAALNELVARINNALERKKKAENLE